MFKSTAGYVEKLGPTIQELILMLYAMGALIIGEPRRLKYHDQHPEAPLSQVYFNLRGKPKGNLSPYQLNLLGRSFTRWLTCQGTETIILAKYIAGIPNAGEALAEGFLDGLHDEGIGGVELIHLEKEESAGSRRILCGEIPSNLAIGARVIMVDDVCSDGESKIEAAAVLRSIGLNPTDCLVFIDREQGGHERLRAGGITLRASCSVSTCLDSLVEMGLIDPDSRSAIDKSLSDLSEYMMNHPG